MRIGVGPRVAGAVEAHARRRHAVRPGEARSLHQPRHRIGEQHVVVVQEQQPLPPRRRRRRVARRPQIAVLLAQHPPPARSELRLDLVQRRQRTRALAPVVHQHRVERRIVLRVHALHRHPHQRRALVVHDAHRHPRLLRPRRARPLRETRPRRLERPRLAVPPRPHLQRTREVPPRTHRAKRRPGELRDAVAQGDVVRGHERAGVVLGGHQLRRPARRGGEERNARLEAFHDRHRGVLHQGGDDREPPRPREVGHRFGRTMIGDRAYLARPAPRRASNELGAADTPGSAAEEGDALRRAPQAREPVDRIHEQEDPLAGFETAEEHHLFEPCAVPSRTLGRRRRRRIRNGKHVRPDERPRRKIVARLAHPFGEMRAHRDERVGELDAAAFHEHPPELALRGHELAAPFRRPQGRRMTHDHEVGRTKGETGRLGEQRTVAEPAPFRNVHDVEGPFADTHPLVESPGGRGHRGDRSPRNAAGDDGFEGDAEVRVEGAPLLHELRVGGIAVDVGDDDRMALLREGTGHVAVSGADPPVLDRAGDVRGGDADALRLAAPTPPCGLVEVAVEGREGGAVPVHAGRRGTGGGVAVRTTGRASAASPFKRRRRRGASRSRPACTPRSSTRRRGSSRDRTGAHTSGRSG